MNALNLLDAEVEDYDQGVFVDPGGNVAEGPNMNLAILTQDNIIVVGACVCLQMLMLSLAPCNSMRITATDNANYCELLPAAQRSFCRPCSLSYMVCRLPQSSTGVTKPH